MAALQHRNGTWRLLFQYNHKQHSVTVGEVSDTEARQWKAKAEHLLMRLNQNMIEMPRGVSIADFILHDGKPPVDPELARHKDTTLHQLREAYLKTFSNGAIETNTLYTAGIHLTQQPERPAIALLRLQSHRGVPGALQKLQIALIGTTRIGVIHCEGAEHLAALGAINRIANHWCCSPGHATNLPHSKRESTARQIHLVDQSKRNAADSEENFRAHDVAATI
jgi:hypothetical protein